MGSNTMEAENREQRPQQQLKHLGFVRVTAINILLYISIVYEYLKQHSGSLRSGVQKVEGTVTSVVGPVCKKFKDVPQHILVFLDHKVDQAEDIFDKNAPTLVKKVACQGCSMIHKVSELTSRLVHDSQTSGISGAASCAVEKSQTYISERAVNAWFALNQFSTFRAVAKVAVPIAAQLSDKYNHMVTDMSNKGYTVFSYLPLVPINRIAKAFEKREVVVSGKETSDRRDASATTSDKKSD